MATSDSETDRAMPLADASVVQETRPVVSAPELKKKELIDMVVTRSGVKKKFAKPVVEAMMTALGEALGEGREVNLQPLGRIKVNRIKDVNNGKVMITRIRQSESAVEDLEEAARAAPAEPVEGAGEASGAEDEKTVTEGVAAPVS